MHITSNEKTLYALIEAGGTKFVCGIVTANCEIIERTRVDTTSPAETLAKCKEFLARYAGRIISLGICSFGPIDVDSKSSTYGSILRTPKPGWSGVNLYQEFHKALGVPVVIDTDVNGAVLAEHAWGAGKGCTDLVYLTVGTGIGGGALCNGQVVHGLMHPEMGHFLVRRHPQDPYTGHCPFHNDCLEGLASGPAIRARWNSGLGDFPESHLAWELEAYYIAQAAMTFSCMFSPQKIIVGGGVMSHAALFPMIRKNLTKSLNGYLTKLGSNVDKYIVAPGLKDDSGMLGGLALAMR